MKHSHAPGLMASLHWHGEPCIGAYATPTRVLFAMFMGGTSFAGVAGWYRVTVQNAEDAYRFEVARRHRHRWATEWVRKHEKRRAT